MKSKESLIRCDWCGTDPLYVTYHDKEWGKPTQEENVLFEFLVLESAQAGLSWITILRKREYYRQAFADFNPQKVAGFDEQKIHELLHFKGIVRNKNKIKSAIINASVFLKIQKEFGTFHTYLYSFLPNKAPIINTFESEKDIPAQNEISIKLSKDLKKRGMKFIGPTICYAYMQAIGMVNDHLISCDFR
ncbi:MAG TPA: DNA-3-methyladenine glycosylase I [Sphingobacterium sp.]|nr:DNA-3-methyladenine glycosylase I [Sphingobacterium sp.]